MSMDETEMNKAANAVYGPVVDIQGIMKDLKDLAQNGREEEIADKLVQQADHKDMNSAKAQKAAILIVLEQYGRRKKEAGARGYAKLVDQMRRSQKEYFRTRDRDRLNESKSLEAQVDKANELIIR